MKFSSSPSPKKPCLKSLYKNNNPKNLQCLLTSSFPLKLLQTYQVFPLLAIHKQSSQDLKSQIQLLPSMRTAMPHPSNQSQRRQWKQLKVQMNHHNQFFQAKRSKIPVITLPKLSSPSSSTLSRLSIP